MEELDDEEPAISQGQRRPSTAVTKQVQKSRNDSVLAQDFSFTMPNFEKITTVLQKEVCTAREDGFAELGN